LRETRFAMTMFEVLLPPTREKVAEGRMRVPFDQHPGGALRRSTG
jgi:hypothetical protein